MSCKQIESHKDIIGRWKRKYPAFVEGMYITEKNEARMGFVIVLFTNLCSLQIFLSTKLRFNQMITVNCWWHCNLQDNILFQKYDKQP